MTVSSLLLSTHYFMKTGILHYLDEIYIYEVSRKGRNERGFMFVKRENKIKGRLNEKHGEEPNTRTTSPQPKLLEIYHSVYGS